MPTFALIAVTWGCSPDLSTPPQPTEWTALPDGSRWRALAVAEHGHPGFSSLPPSRTGVDHANQVDDRILRQNEFLSNGSGVAIGDVDGDGLPDLYFARLEGPNALYRNLGDWRFEEVAGVSGVAAGDRFSTGAVFADVDGDGDDDLFLTALGGPNGLFENDGTGRFRDLTAEAGLTSDAGSTTAAFADVEGDGDLDLYVASYKRRSANDIFPPEERSLSRTVDRSGAVARVAPEFEDHYEIEWRGNELRRVQVGEPDRFYLNDGSGRFAEAALDGGRFLDENGVPLSAAPRDWGLAARFQDLDGDGDPDLYVCNDFQSPDRVWINDGAGTFSRLPPLSIRTTSASCMSVDFSDVEGDGDLDIFAVDMLSRDARRARASFPVVGLDAALPGETDATQQVQRNVLLLARGDGSYAETARYAKLEASEWSWSAAFVDVDLDGDEDLLIPNGHRHDIMDADAQIRLQRAVLADWRDHLLFYRPLRTRNVAFRNDGGLRFAEVGEEWQFGTEEDISHGIATGDLDGDGDLDAVVSRLGAPPLLLRNEATAPRVAVRLEGQAPNTRGVGAVVRLIGGPVPVQRKEVTAGGRYLSGSEPVLSFAAAAGPDAVIEVRWRSGATSRIEDAGPDRLYVIREPATVASPAEQGGQAPGTGVPDAETSAGPYFERMPLDHLHVETPYGDFARQPSMPNQLSGMGPGVAWTDIESDGDPDLVIGTGRGGAPALYRNDGGRLVRVVLAVPPAGFDLVSVLGMPGGQVPLILFGQVSYEIADPVSARAVPSVIGLAIDPARMGSDEIAPARGAIAEGDSASAGPMALADYDGDGDLDLFVGGRVVPGRYPAPASSRLFLDQDGRFVLDASNSAVLRGLGLATSAVFSDVDGDGDPDLIVATEWGPVRLYANREGRFEDRTTDWGLAPHTGRWNGVASGDFDNDGRMDLVATSWGLNTELTATPEHPIRLYWGDLDGNGSVEAIQAQWEPDLNGYAPVDRFDRLTAAIPFIRSRVESYRGYAEATVEPLLGSAGSRARVLEASRLDHVVFLNRGDRFEVVPLPPEAQWAPAFHPAIGDLDGDGAEDIFLSQNFSGTGGFAERHAEGLGIWLRGDGSAGFAPVPVRESGIRLTGDQRGAAVADFDADGRLDLAVAQNAAPAWLFRNRSARPGLRIRLSGPPGNPHAVGAVVRVEYEGGESGPAREIQAGYGLGSQDWNVPTLGLAAAPRALLVRWPGGEETRHELDAGIASGAGEVSLSRPGGS